MADLRIELLTHWPVGRGEAQRQYEHLRDLFAAELGAEPSPETQQLLRIGQHHLGERMARVLQHVAELEPTELAVVASVHRGIEPALTARGRSAFPSIQVIT